jgi:hypothetical protein
MNTLADRWHNLWERIKGSPTFTPAQIDLPANRVDPVPAAVQQFSPGDHYFQVRVTRLFLAKGREWLTKIDPLVCTVTEALYGTETVSVPSVVGPAKLAAARSQGLQIETPHGMVLTNTLVAGLYPFCGGGLTLTVILCKVKKENFGLKMLGLVESAASALDFSTAVASYAKVGKVVLEGVEALTGDSGTTPLVGERISFDLDAGQKIIPGHRAVVNAKCDPSKFWVKKDELCVGDTLAKAVPYIEADYVLYEIARTDSRSDVQKLPFYPLFERVKEEAARDGSDSWEQAKANMLALYQAMVLSPDVTKAQREKLVDSYIKEMQEIRKTKEKIQALGPAERDKKERTALDAAVNVLKIQA